MVLREGSIRTASTTSRVIAKDIAEFASDKKALDIVVLDMRKVANFCDYFVLCSGNTDRQVKAVADGIEEGLYTRGIKVKRPEGMMDKNWVVLDLGDVVAHVFQKDAREFYRLEYLWQEAKTVEWEKDKKRS